MAVRDFESLRCFQLVVELGGFTAAGKRLRLSTNAVSKRVQKLEEELGGRLLRRSTRQVELTPFGELCYEQSKCVLRQIQELEALSTASSTRDIEGSVRVRVGPSVARQVLYRHLASFRASYPAIRIDIAVGEDENGSASTRGADVLLGYPHIPGMTDAWRAWPILQLRHTLCASPRLFKKGAPAPEEKDLLNLPFLSHRERFPRDRFTLADGRVLRTSEPHIVVNDFNTLTRLCLQGLGVLLTAVELVEPHLKKGDLIAILPRLPLA